MDAIQDALEGLTGARSVNLLYYLLFAYHNFFYTLGATRVC